MRLGFLLRLLIASLLPAASLAVGSDVSFLSSYDRYVMDATDALETDKTGSGFSLSLGSHASLASGQLFYGIGFRRAQAQGENYDRQQELDVADILVRLGYLHPVPGLERYLKGGIMADVTRGKGSSLGYEEASTMQTMARLAPVLQWHFPLEGAWQPFLEASHSWDLNNRSYRENRNSIGLGIQLSLGAAPPAEPTRPVEEAVVEPTPPAAPASVPEPAVQKVEASIRIGGEALTFGLGDATVHAPMKDYLLLLVEILKSQPEAWTRLSFEGFVEQNESELSGPDLGKKRAAALHDFVARQGFPDKQLSLGEAAFGETVRLPFQRADPIIHGYSKDQLKAIEARLAEQYASRTLSLRLEILTMDKSKVDVGPNGQKFLMELGRLLKDQSDQWTSVLVKGFTDARGNSEVNRRVATQRGEKQAALLMHEGLGQDRITSLGIVTSILLDPQNPTSHWNRRAEIEIHGVRNREELRAKIDALVEQNKS